jgi:hypothetical protein
MQKYIILIAGLLALTSCGMTNNTMNIGSSTGVATNSNYTQDLDATSIKIKNSDEFQGCMKQNTNMCIQAAGMQLAQKAKDPAFCKELSTVDQQSSCQFAVTMMSATEKSDGTICDTISDTNYQKQCKVQIYKQQSISKKDITLCNKIDELMKPTGTGMILDAGMQKDQCIMQYIMSDTQSDSKDCEKLSSRGSLDMCKMMIKNRPTTPNMPTLPPLSPANQR